MNSPHPNSHHPMPDDSAQACMASLQSLALEETGLHVGIRHEPVAVRDGSLSCFIVSVPVEATAEQKAEIDYLANEILSFFSYEEIITEDWPYPLLNYMVMTEDGFRIRMDWKSEDWRSKVWKSEE